MQPHQQRVIDEKKELDIKLDKLTDFLKSERSKTVSLPDIELLVKQQDVMSEYSSILARRIVNFK